MALASKKSRFEPSAYEKKIAELHLKVADEAKKLQKAIEAKDAALREISDLGERKARLLKQIAGLEEEANLEHKRLEHEIELRNSFIESAKTELKREESKLASVAKNVEELTNQLKELEPVFKEVQGFITKEHNARIKFLETQEKLQKTEEKEKEIRKSIEEEKIALSIRQTELEGEYDQIKEFSGRLTQNLRHVREATEYLNKSLEERGVPLTYGLPPDKITEIPFQ